jgi:Plavaka transposase
MINPNGNLHHCIPILMAWAADLKEQYDILGLAPNSCISCMAQFQQLGNLEPCQHCTGDSILKEIHCICSQFPEANTWQFTGKAKESGLASVEELCWAGLHVDICCIMCPNNLHGLHKFSYDHLMKWLTNTIGESELD